MCITILQYLALKSLQIDGECSSDLHDLDSANFLGLLSDCFGIQAEVNFLCEYDFHGYSVHRCDKLLRFLCEYRNLVARLV